MVTVSILQLRPGPRYSMHSLVYQVASGFPDPGSANTRRAGLRFVEWMLAEVGKELVRLTPKKACKLEARAEALEIIRLETLNFREAAKRMPEYPWFCTNLEAIARAFYYMGYYSEEVHMRQAVVTLCRGDAGPGHPRTLASMNNLADALHLMGKHAEAAEMHEEVLVVRRRMLGPSNPLTLSSMNNLARALQALGRHGKAVEVHQEVLNIRRKIFGHGT